MGGEVAELVFAKTGPTVILLAGLQGVGKTTVSAKLALYLKKQVRVRELLSVKVWMSQVCINLLSFWLQGKNCMLIAGDVYRPAAIDQLVILGEQVLP